MNEALRDLATKSAHWNGIQSDDIKMAHMNVNRLLLNYLSSIKTFIDHCETKINRKFGEESAEFIEFKKILSIFYDNSFAYRFFYRLRNYSQHCGLPIHNISTSSIRNHEENKRTTEFKVAFDRDALLRDFKKWKTVKGDLEKMPERFDLYPLLFEMTHNIAEIERNIEVLLKTKLVKAAEQVMALTKVARDTGGEVFITEGIEVGEGGKVDSINMFYMPFGLIDSIMEMP